MPDLPRIKENGNPYVAHRVIEPRGVLPQPALKIDNCVDAIYDNEILVDVRTLNIDSASFTQIREAAGRGEKIIADTILRESPAIRAAYEKMYAQRFYLRRSHQISEWRHHETL